MTATPQLSNFTVSHLDQIRDQQIGRFPPLLETEFQDEHFSRTVTRLRVAGPVILVLVLLFALIDLQLVTADRPVILTLRFGIMAPTVLVYCLLVYRPSIRTWWMTITQAALILMAFVINMMGVVGQLGGSGQNLYLGLTILLAVGYTLAGLSFWRSTINGLVITLFVLSTMYALQSPGSRQLFWETIPIMLAINLFGMLSAYFFERANRRDFLQRRMIEQEQARVQQLLLNILPASIVRRLENGEEVADFFSSATVMFADIVNFTPYSARLAPARVVSLLNQIFSKFDQLAENYQVEKVKTVGDAYMVVCGVPNPNPDHARVVAELALEVRDAMARLGVGLTLRIGIHSGPLVAGVIGLKKFAYDLWGDTVNTASRMESHGVPGEIQVSEDTYQLLRGRFRFCERGPIEVKGKGLMNVYLLEGRCDEPCLDLMPHPSVISVDP